MDHETIIERIKIRARKVSASLLQDDSVYSSRVCKVIKIQSFARMYLAKKKYKKLIKRMHQRKRVCEELRNTEKDYINDLDTIVRQVMKKVQDIVDEQMFKMLFINLPQLQELHKRFYDQLKKQVDTYDPFKTCVSKNIFSFSAQIKHVYYKFCLEYKKSHQILRLLNISNSAFKGFIQQLQKEGILKLELASYLIKPVQRICKYPILLNELIKNTEETHVDYDNLKSALSTLATIVKETNDEIEEFVKQAKLQELNKIYDNVRNQGGKFIFEGRAGYIHDQKEYDCSIYVFANMILLSQHNKESLRFHFDETSKVRDAPPAKYFKNLIYLTSRKKAITLTCTTSQLKMQLLGILKQTLNSTYMKQQNYIEVDVEGAEQRESMFKKYTVYIVNIKAPTREYKIYPRFSELIEVEQIVRKRLPTLDIPHLEKDDWYSSRKTKIIEMRKFVIKEFLSAILNQAKVRTINAVFSALHIEQFLQSPSLVKKQSSYDQNVVSIEVMVAGDKQLTCWVSHKAKVAELKQQIAFLLGLQHATEYQLFQVKDKAKRLIYEEEHVCKLIPSKSGFLSFFQEKPVLIYTRYCYLSEQEQLNLYKEDSVRCHLELAIIRGCMEQFNMDVEVLMAVMALYAKYLGIEYQNDKKAQQYLNTFKHPGLNIFMFREYCYEIEEVIKKQNMCIPIVCIKIMNQIELYRCAMFPVDVYQKTLKQVRKQIDLDDKILLGVKRQKILLLTLKKETILSIPYDRMKEMNVYPTSLVFNITNLKNTIRVDSAQSYQISKLINHYTRINKSELITKNFPDV